MTWVTAGTDTYGRVKNVGGTSVVTKFAMLSALPLWPVQSFFYCGISEKQTEGVPFLCWSTTTTISGMPLTCVDRYSVLMAYLRGAFAALTVLGCFSFVVMYLS